MPWGPGQGQPRSGLLVSSLLLPEPGTQGRVALGGVGAKVLVTLKAGAMLRDSSGSSPK